MGEHFRRSVVPAVSQRHQIERVYKGFSIRHMTCLGISFVGDLKYSAVGTRKSAFLLDKSSRKN
jgi:hypothetical protein